MISREVSQMSYNFGGIATEVKITLHMFTRLTSLEVTTNICAEDFKLSVIKTNFHYVTINCFKRAGALCYLFYI